jgi:hypothetical protein
MARRGYEIPTRLKNGTRRPGAFDDIVEALSGIKPRYKIVAYSINPLNGYRLVHWHYISLVNDNDPSRIQTFMREVNKNPINGFEEGQLVDDMMSYSFYLSFDEMIALSGRLGEIVQNHSNDYVRVAYDAVVQYSSKIVYSGISRLD